MISVQTQTQAQSTDSNVAQNTVQKNTSIQLEQCSFFLQMAADDFNMRSSSILIRSLPEIMQFQSESAETFMKAGKLRRIWNFSGRGSPCGMTCSGSRLTSNYPENAENALDLSGTVFIPYCLSKAWHFSFITLLGYFLNLCDYRKPLRLSRIQINIL